MTLVIMAAGIGSRFGGGIKQLQRVDECGHIIMDYSVHDAIAAGFNKIIFIIRHDMEAEFREIIGNRIEQICKPLGVDICYAFQQSPNAESGRTKPWGTGHAVLACKGIINEPFAVINADDYYGVSAFAKIADYLKHYDRSKPMDFCMAGFILKNTLSDNGAVTRGLCKVDANSYLTKIVETKNIVKTADGAEADGIKLDGNGHVSMNMWGFTPDFMPVLEEGFTDFLSKLEIGDVKSEFLIPIFIGDLLDEGKVSVKVLESRDKWFGMTYKEDVPAVTEAFAELINSGVYSKELYSDLYVI